MIFLASCREVDEIGPERPLDHSAHIPFSFPCLLLSALPQRRSRHAGQSVQCIARRIVSEPRVEIKQALRQVRVQRRRRQLRGAAVSSCLALRWLFSLQRRETAKALPWPQQCSA